MKEIVMGEKPISSPPVWFWIISGVALLWNLMGLAAFVFELMMPESVRETLPESQRKLYEVMPSWYWIAFGAAVVFGVIGCVLLLMRKSLATPVFVLSLLGVLAQQTYMFFLSDTFEVMGSAAMAFPIIVLLVAIGLIFFSNMSRGRSWIR